MAGAQVVPVPPDLEPVGAPPLTLPEEPQYAPPSGLGEPSLFEAEASSCTQLHFTTPVPWRPRSAVLSVDRVSPHAAV